MEYTIIRWPRTELQRIHIVYQIKLARITHNGAGNKRILVKGELRYNREEGVRIKEIKANKSALYT